MIQEETPNDIPYMNFDSEPLVNILKKTSDNQITVRYGREGIENTESLSEILNYYSKEELENLLASLTARNILEKTRQTTILLCPECGHNASLVIHTCPSCGSTKISEKTVIRHKKCGFMASKQNYVEGTHLRCPSCREIIESNIDFDESPISTQQYYECSDCGRNLNHSDVNMVCLNCRNRYHPNKAHKVSLVTYKYTWKDIEYEETPEPLSVSLLSESLLADPDEPDPLPVSNLFEDLYTDPDIPKSQHKEPSPQKVNKEPSKRVIVPSELKIRRVKKKKTSHKTIKTGINKEDK